MEICPGAAILGLSGPPKSGRYSKAKTGAQCAAWKTKAGARVIRVERSMVFQKKKKKSGGRGEAFYVLVPDGKDTGRQPGENDLVPGRAAFLVREPLPKGHARKEGPLSWSSILTSSSPRAAKSRSSDPRAPPRRGDLGAARARPGRGAPGGHFAPAPLAARRARLRGFASRQI